MLTLLFNLLLLFIIHFFYVIFVLLEDQGLPDEVFSVIKKEGTKSRELFNHYKEIGRYAHMYKKSGVLAPLRAGHTELHWISMVPLYHDSLSVYTKVSNAFIPPQANHTLTMHQLPPCHSPPPPSPPLYPPLPFSCTLR